MRDAIFIFFLLSFLSGVGVAAEEQKTTPEELLDISKVQNPFVSAFYVPPDKVKPQIIKTPVEPPVQKVDNGEDFVTRRIKKAKEDARAPRGGAEKASEKVVKKPTNTLSVFVQGIVWGIDRPQAIVDGDVVGIGDKIKGATITAITKDGIDVLLSGEKIHVPMDQ